MRTVGMALLAAVLGGIVVLLLPSGLPPDDALPRMRRLGIAAAQYQADFDAWPVSATVLAESGRVPKDLLAVKSDRTPQGYGNRWLPERERPDFRNSFVGVRESKTEFADVDGVAAGWLLDVSRSRHPSFPDRIWGEYRRLLYDGSVRTRRIRLIHQPSGKRVRQSEMLFVDPLPEPMESYEP